MTTLLRTFARRLLAWILVVGIVALGTPAGALPTDGSTLPNDRGLTASSTPGADGVTADVFTGAANFQVPIELPAGTGGVSPELGLSYSSAFSGDSWVGFGWTLGFPSIQRSLKQGTPSYDAADIFELAGEELVEIAPDEYRTRRESFARIRYDASADTWTVWRPDGTRLTLGLTDDGRVKNGAGATFQWLLEKQADPNGNVVSVSYDRASDPGTAYPQTVRYTLRLVSPEFARRMRLPGEA